MATDQGTKTPSPAAPVAPAVPAAPWHHDVASKDLKVIGGTVRKVDAHSKVAGLTLFADDLKLPRMLFMKLLRSPHAHARIVRKKLAPVFVARALRECR